MRAAMRILVVEDELKMASLLRRGLQEEGHAVDLARTGDDALWMARAAEYDAVVLDLMLPGLDGIEVCRRLRDGRRLGARPHAHRTRRGRGPGRRASTPARTTTSRSRSPSRSCSRASGRSSGAAPASGPPCSRSATCASTPPPAGRGAARSR